MAMPKEITITWGPETYHMGNYSSYRVGPMSLTLALTPGEPIVPAIKEAIETLQKQSQLLFVAQRTAFQERYVVRNG